MTTFRNRIIEYGVKPADQFLAHPKNARLHPQFQRDVMQAALDSIGFVAPVIEAKSGYLLDGHERIYQALANNSDVPYVKVDVDEDEESYILATFDPITALAKYDTQLLDGLLQEVNSDSEAVQRMLSQLGASNGIGEPFNPYDEWVGMPEFEQDDLQGIILHVHFENEKDRADFFNKIGQSFTDKTKSIWYPRRPINLRNQLGNSLVYTDES